MATDISNPATLDRGTVASTSSGFRSLNPRGGSSERRGQRLANPTDKRDPEHSELGTSLRQIIEHLRQVHHPFLRSQLSQMESLLDEVAIGGNLNVSDLRKMLSRLHQEVASSMLRAEHVAFPQVIALEEAVTLNLPTVAPLQQSVARAGCSLEAQHATGVQAMWNLLRLADRLKDAQACEPVNKFQHQLSGLASDFYQYLHELHAVLLPRAAALELRSAAAHPAINQEDKYCAPASKL